jgi:hypothetical protein
MPLHLVNGVLKQNFSNMNIFTNVKANTMHEDKNPNNFDFIFSNPMFKSTLDLWITIYDDVPFKRL